MSATNSTTNYHLPIFIGTDIPSWLVDWNNAMTNLDNAVGEALLAGQTAEADVKALESTVKSIQTAVTTLTNSVNDNTTDITDLTGQMVAYTQIVNQLTADVQNLTSRVETAEGTVGTVYAGIVGTGETTVTVSTPIITANSMIDVYTDEYGLVPTSVVGDASAKTVTVTVPVRESNLNVKVVVRN